MKKWISLLLIGLLIVTAGCKKTKKDETAPPSGAAYKIGIVTGGAVYNEAIFAAKRLSQQYDFIVTRTYPDNLSAESTVSICTELAEDPAMRAIVFVRAVAGIDDAIDKVKASRPDILFVVGADTEDAAFVASKADLCLAQDMYKMGTEIINEAYRMGARRFIHYTFARHLLSEPIIRRREIMVQRCTELGIEFIDITTPDPLSAEGGGAEARQFIQEDVPEQVGNYGTSTAFFCTDCTVLPELIKVVMECGAILPQQCCPSPFHGYTSFFGIDAGEYDDPDGVLRQIAEGVAAYGNTGHMATWPISSDILMVEAGTKYAIDYCEGTIGKEADKENMQKIITSLSGGRCKISSALGADNCLLFLCDYYML